MPAKSPDGRFVIRRMSAAESDVQGVDGEGGPAIFEIKTGKKFPGISEDALNTFTNGLRAVWSKDSTRIAVNYQAGTRYFVSEFLVWNGKRFDKLPSPEELLMQMLEKERAAQIKAAGLKDDIHQRRIEDTYATRRWIDENTIELDARSIRTVPIGKPGEDDITDIEANFRCTLKLDAKSKKWKVLKAEKFKSE